jgi:hypothetical protein
MNRNSHHQKVAQKRFGFSAEEDAFLCHIMNGLETLNDECLWNQLTSIFNSKFPFSSKTCQQLKQHFQNCLRKDLRDGGFSHEEKETFFTLREEDHKSLSEIATEMKRTTQSVKNYFYRHYKSQKKRNRLFEDEYYNAENEFMTYENDYQFYGITADDF